VCELDGRLSGGDGVNVRNSLAVAENAEVKAGVQNRERMLEGVCGRR
jgi:hypothetical protein